MTIYVETDLGGRVPLRGYRNSWDQNDWLANARELSGHDPVTGKLKKDESKKDEPKNER